MEIVALLNGRGNNTLKDKNIREVFGKPLLAYPAQAAKQSSRIQDFYVSSDDEKIRSVAHKLGYKKINRPEEFGRPDSNQYDVILHALEKMKDEGVEPDILVVLLANSVSVKAEWIDRCVDEIQNDPTLSAVVPVVSDLDHHPYRAKRRGKRGFWSLFLILTIRKFLVIDKRLGTVFFYAIISGCLMSKNRFTPKRGRLHGNSWGIVLNPSKLNGLLTSIRRKIWIDVNFG